MDKELEQFIHSLYLKYASQLYYRAYRILGDEDEAEDLVHETFVIAVGKAEKLQEHPNPCGWLHVTLNHLLYKRLRTIHISESLLGDEINLFADKDKNSDLMQILPLQLTEKERQILILRYQHNYSYREIAKTLGISLSACGMRLKRAEKRCRELLEKEK